MSIPVFIHHEGAHSYVADCIKQAKKFHERVVLFGDKSNSSMCNEWIDVSNFYSPLWEEFRKYYKHMSSNGSKFEMMCFKRFFIFDDFMRNNQIDECICLDSDVLVFINFSSIHVLKYCDAAFGVFEKDQLAWGGQGYWRQETLHSFLIYCIDIYKNQQKKLKELWAVFQKKRIPGGISDMTLLYLWYKETGKKVWIWTKYRKTGVVDDNYGSSANYLEDEYYLDRLGIGKRIIVKKGKPYFVSIMHGPVRAYSIHFQGERKVYMHCFRKYNRVVFLLAFIKYINKCFDKFKI